MTQHLIRTIKFTDKTTPDHIADLGSIEEMTFDELFRDTFKYDRKNWQGNKLNNAQQNGWHITNTQYRDFSEVVLNFQRIKKEAKKAGWKMRYAQEEIDPDCWVDDMNIIEFETTKGAVLRSFCRTS